MLKYNKYLFIIALMTTENFKIPEERKIEAPSILSNIGKISAALSSIIFSEHLDFEGQVKSLERQRKKISGILETNTEDSKY